MAKEKKVKETTEKVKKPIYKKWWFWAIIIFLVFGTFSLNDNSSDESTADTSTEQTQEEESAATTTEAIELTAGEVGDYGKDIVMNEGTDMEEKLTVYYVPAGEYNVTNIGEYPTQVSVYSGFHRDESTGYDDYDDVGDTPRIEVNETVKITVPDGWFIEIHEPTHITLEPAA